VVYRVFRMPPAAAERIRASFLLYWPLWASGAVWIFFSIYWEIAAKNAAQEKSAESSALRGLHVFMANAALLLLFVPVPGLTRRCLPAPQVFVPIGLIIQRRNESARRLRRRLERLPPFHGVPFAEAVLMCSAPVFAGNRAPLIVTEM
jgi:hypothetical protein